MNTTTDADPTPKTFVFGLAPITPKDLEHKYLLLEQHQHGSHIFNPMSDLIGSRHSMIQLEKNRHGIVYRFCLNLVCGNKLYIYNIISEDEIAMYGLDIPTVFLNLMDNFFHFNISSSSSNSSNPSDSSNSSVHSSVHSSNTNLDDYEILGTMGTIGTMDVMVQFEDMGTSGTTNDVSNQV